MCGPTQAVRSSAPSVAHRLHAPGDHTVAHAVAPGVCGTDHARGRVGQQHGHAVGHPHHQDDVRAVGDQGVALLAPGGR